MKVKKTLFCILTAIGVCAVATTTITSCSGVSTTIKKNMIDQNAGHGNFTGGDAPVTLDQEIKTALTDKSATDAFKKSVVNKVLTNWYEKLAKNGVGSFKTDLDKFNSDIDTDYKNQIKSSKDAHKGNWQYYFQNEVLNPVGGTKAAWKENQLESKIRSYFTDKFISQNYLSVPSFHKGSANQTDNRDLNLDVASYFDTDSGHLGSAAMTAPGTGDTELLNPDWWPMINFYATANPSFANASDGDRNKFQDDTYALFQREAFDEYTSNVGPISTSMVLWQYTLGNEKNLDNIYNTKFLGGATASSANGDDPAPSSGAALGYTFPYFGNDLTSIPGPNDKFKDFVTNFKGVGTAGGTFFLNDRGDYTTRATNGYNIVSDNDEMGALGLSNIPFADHYTQDKSDLFLASRFNIAGTDGAFPTYTAPLLNLFNHGMTSIDATMPKIKTSQIQGLASTHGDIMQNFLFAAPGSTIDGADVKELTAAIGATATTAGVFDLSKVYGSVGTGTAVRNRLFANLADGGTTKDSVWYAQGAQYVVSGLQLSDNTSAGNLLPYIMIRTDPQGKGVHVEGVDGYSYLNQAETPPTPPTPTPDPDSTYGEWKENWRPGAPWSQERENALLKYRTAYENQRASLSKTPIYGDPLNIISKKASDSKASGALVTYIGQGDNEDSIILNLINRVMNNTDGLTSNTYKDQDVLGLKDVDLDNGADWNKYLGALMIALDALNKFESIVTKYDDVNKSLFAWGDTYRANELLGSSGQTPGDGQANYKVPYLNGLAQALPLAMASGTPGDATDVYKGNFNKNMRTHYDVVYDSMNALAVANIKTVANVDYTSIESISYTTLINDINSTYDAWSKSSVKWDSKAYAYNYSENILTNNQYVNDLLWAFGSTNNFSSNVKTLALQKYIGTAFDASNYSDAIASMFISTQLMGGSNSLLTSYQNKTFNTTTTPDDSVDNYSKLLTQEWNYSLATDRSSGVNANGIAAGYSDKVINYDTLLASIKYLTDNGKIGDANTQYQHFIEWLNQKIGNASWSNNMGYLVWMTQNDSDVDSAFKDRIVGNTSDKNASSLYGWHANYDGMFEKTYQNTNSDAVANPSAGKTYASFDKYWQFGPMPRAYDDAGTAASNNINAMGFMGLQTQNSNSLSSSVKSALFDSYNNACDTQSSTANFKRTGSLYAYAVTKHNPISTPNDVVDPLASRTKLADQARSLKTPSDISALATYIQNQTGVFGEIINEIDHEDDTGMKQTILVNAIEKTTGGILKDNFFKGYNLNNDTAGITPTLELCNEHGSYNFYDDGKENGPSSRVRVMQINKNDIEVKNNNYKDVYDNLSTQLGADMMNYLIVQAAMDTSVQSTVISLVIQNLSNGKIVVYDRRFNDQLGSSWVKDWKTKN